jgi:hypothetical protein
LSWPWGRPVFFSYTLYRCASLRKIVPSLISGASISPPQGFAHTVGWLFDVFAASVRDPAGLAGVPGMAFFVVGVAALFRTDRGLGWMVCGSCIATLLATFAIDIHWAAGCCYSRLRSYRSLSPKGSAVLHSQGKLVHVVVARIVLFLPLLNAIRGGLRSVSGIQRDDIRPVIEYLNAHAYLYDLGEAKR